MADVRFVAIGDSFTEGVGDELDDGTVRGWADIAAQGWANALGEPIHYANLAIRGKLMRPILAEQLEAALALRPTHLSFNGGGNDILRPRTKISFLADSYFHVMERCREEGVILFVASGALPEGLLPMSGLIRKRGDDFQRAVESRMDANATDQLRVFNWRDEVLREPSFWSVDRLHMNVRGHHRVAARVLDAAGLTPPASWWSLPESEARHLPALSYYRGYVGPWVKRRLTGTSSGDGRTAKFPEWVEVPPAG